LQIKNKKRVEEHGEVFTSKKEVNAMLDLVQKETIRIESRFLEPACGNGNFLIEIFKRKIEVVREKYRKNQLEFECYAVLAVSSLYGIEILEDNVEECRERLLNIFSEVYKKEYPDSFKDKCFNTVKFIFKKNIVYGDALALEVGGKKNTPIIFSEWSFVSNYMIKRRDFTLSNLIAYRPMEGENLFSDLGEEAFIPKTVKEYPLQNFLDISDEH
jgi:hypothetical protein